jgi:hypothetical protein
METLLDPLTEVQDRVIHAIAATKRPVTDAVTKAVEFVLDRVGEVPVLPYAEKLPTPVELIDHQAKFASKLVSTNKSVALSAAKAAAPLTDKLLDRPAVRPVRKAKAA